jgi:hypothetical protein
MLKTKLNMTVASALMVGGMVAVLSTSAQADTVGTIVSASSTLCMLTKLGNPGGCADSNLSGTINYTTGVIAFGANMFIDTPWTVHDSAFLAPGAYTDVLGVASYDFTVGANQIGASMLFDWGDGTVAGTNRNMRVVSLWNVDDSTPGFRKLTPVDADGDTFPGAKMVDVFVDQAPVFTITTTIPVPAAAWLFGSGLLGLVGVARRRNKASA